MAPVFELLLLPTEGEDVGVSEGEDVVTAGKTVGLGEVLVVAPIVKMVETPMNAPGPISGLSGIRRCEASPKPKSERRIPTADGHRLRGVPKALVQALVCVISTCREGNIGTNRDVLEGPLRYTGSHRDRVRKPVGQSPPSA